MAGAKTQAAVGAGPRRDPDRTRAKLLAAARDAFAASGLAGARVDAIADAAGVNKRMLYYYFSNKEGLFLAVLEGIYEDLLIATRDLDWTAPPLVALERYCDFVWRYYQDNPAAIKLLNSENLHRARHLKQSTRVSDLSRPFIGELQQLLDAGRRTGEMRDDLDPMTLHISVVGLAYYYLSNADTLSIFFECNLRDERRQETWRRHLIDAVLRIARA